MEEITKKEIQPINSEFYLNINEYYHLIDSIFRQLRSNKTSFKDFISGNNVTLNPNDSIVYIYQENWKNIIILFKDQKIFFFSFIQAKL